MPDSNTPASQMIRVPTVLIDAVKELSRLHRSGRTRAVLADLQQLIADIDSRSDSANNPDSSLASDADSRIDSDVIAKMITNQLAPLQERLEEHIEQRISEVIQGEVDTMLGELHA